MDEFYKEPLSKGAVKYYEKVRDLIQYCNYDQSYDGSEVIWLWGQQAELGEVLADNKVPDKYIDEVASHMSCNGCGCEDFDRYSTIGLIDLIDKEVQDKIEKANKKYKKHIEKLLEYINSYPSLALNNPVAKAIHKEISNSKVPECTIENVTVYRCRMPEGNKTFSFKEIHAPEVGISNAGRYNHFGQSVLYVSSYPETAVTEVSGESKGDIKIWMQKYTIKKIGKILDLTSDWEGFLKLSTIFTAIINNRILEQTSPGNTSTWKPEYLFTIFISDCAKSCGYNGIKYPAIKGVGENYVFFDPLNKEIVPAEPPPTHRFQIQS